MENYLSTWLSGQGVAPEYLSLATLSVGTMLILLVAVLSHYLIRHQLMVAIEKVVTRSKNTWDDLILEQGVFNRATSLVPLVLIWFLLPYVIAAESSMLVVFIVLIKVALTYQVARVLSALLNVIKSIYRNMARERYLPLNSAIQVVKLLIYLVATILSVSYILNKSPLYLLSGLGALTAVLLLVFQDTIKGLVASIQISANKMLAPGDWIEMPNYGADGDVLEIGLSTVKVQNFDRTITTIPTYALISSSFKNWRGMLASGGRRIKRSIFVDVTSIRFYQPDEIASLSSIHLIADYLQAKQTDIAMFHKQHGINSEDRVNQRQLTNVGTFRAYIEAYLKQHPKVHQQMTCMARQLPTVGSGLPIELYFFSNDQNWINYEGIMADIFDHLYAMAPTFGLRMFQHPTGSDWRERQS